MTVDPNLLSKILNHLGTMIRSRNELISWMEEFISDIKTQEIAINSVKTGAAALGVVSFIGLFTPFAPLAIGGLVAAGGAGVVTTIGDVIANKIKGGNLEGKIDSMKEDDSKLEELLNKLDVQAEQLVKDITKENAGLFLLVGVPIVLGGFGAVIGIADVVYRWNTGNPNRESAEKLLPQLQENVKGLKQLKKQLSELNK